MYISVDETGGIHYKNGMNIANDDIEISKDLIEELDEEKLKDSEYMSKMISKYPNILQLYKEKYDNIAHPENLYRQLIESEEFTDGILSMYAEKISVSGEVQSRTVLGDRRNPTVTEFYFTENTPMGEFEEKMSWETRKIFSNILSEKLYKISNQLDREAEEGKEINPNFSSHHMFVVSQALKNAYSVAEAVYMANQRNLGIFNPEMLAQFRPQGLSVEQVAGISADNIRGGVQKIQATTEELNKGIKGEDVTVKKGKDENSHYYE